MRLPSALAILSLFAAVPAGAAVLGPDAAVCAANGPAMLVKISGFKNRVGNVRVRSFTGDPENWFDKRYALVRIEVPIPAAGPVEICVPVKAPGTYAVDVRHDANRNGKTDRSDGAGASGNPDLSLFDVIFKRRPDPAVVGVAVGHNTVVVPVRLKYL